MMDDAPTASSIWGALKNAAIGACICEVSGRFTAVNKAYTVLTGYAATELVSTNCRRITHPEDLPAALSRARRFAAGRVKSSVHEKRYVRKGGGIVWVRNTVSLIPKRAGHATLHCLCLSEDITEEKRIGEHLQKTNARLRRLSGELLHAEDKERRRIARELHDSTAQMLAGLSINLTRLHEFLPDSPAAQRLLRDSEALTGACVKEIRTISYLLHPPSVTELGLAAALKSYAAGFSARTGIKVDVKAVAAFDSVPREIEFTIFRVVQEGLANVYRHSGSARATIALKRTADAVHLLIADRGRGLGATPGREDLPGIGLAGMRERAELLGGCLSITRQGIGTRLKLVLPAPRL